MYPSLVDPTVLQMGIDHVRKSDSQIGSLVANHGTIAFKPRGLVFRSLVDSIISQQLNGSVADLITSRVNALFHPKRLTPEGLLRISSSKLRRAGVSPQKVGYLKDLSARTVDGRLDLTRLKDKADEEVIEELDEVKGVGPWTAQMVLMFSLGRPDVLPVDDYGIKKAIRAVYGLRDLPGHSEIEAIAKPWHPYSTVACLYLWRQKDLNP